MASLMDMDKRKLRTCKLCKGLFFYQGYGYGYCERCAAIDDEIFHKVKDYIWEHPMATVTEVSEEVNVSENLIYNYLKDGRLEIPDGSPIYLKCENCGTDIRFGRYCPECATQIHKNLSSVTEAELCEIGERPGGEKKGKIHFQYQK